MAFSLFVSTIDETNQGQYRRSNWRNEIEVVILIDQASFIQGCFNSSQKGLLIEQLLTANRL